MNFDTISFDNLHCEWPVIELLKHYFNIAFLMKKPQDLPAGAEQMQYGIVFSFVANVLALVGFVGVGRASMLSLLDIVFSGLFLYIALMLTNRLPRFAQSFGGLCGASAVLYCAAIPMLWLTRPDANAEVGMLAQFAQFLLLVWSLSLVAHIIRHTFEIRLWTSVGLAFAYYIVISSLLDVVLPNEAASELTNYEVSSVCGELVTQCLTVI